MTKKERTYQVLIVAARAVAALVSAPVAYVAFWSFVWSDMEAPGSWPLVSWETAGVVSFLGYAVFIMLPVRRPRPWAFWLAVVVGCVLALGSTWMSKGLYEVVIADHLEGGLVYHAIAWVLLFPFYAYIPILLLNRKHRATDDRTNPPTEGTHSVEG